MARANPTDAAMVIAPARTRFACCIQPRSPSMSRLRGVFGEREALAGQAEHDPDDEVEDTRQDAVPEQRTGHRRGTVEARRASLVAGHRQPSARRDHDAP
jgi:hypothetical protein